MEFDKIQLPPFIIAGLYKYSLVVLDGEIMPDAKDGGWRMADDGQSQTNDQTLKNLQLREAGNTLVENKYMPSTASDQNKSTQKNVEEIVLQTIIADEQPNETNIQPAVSHVANHAPPSTPNIKYLGGFGKKISIVLEDHFHPNINDNDLAFLTKLLQACQLSLNDVAIINVVSNRAISNQLWQLMPAEKMIIFDIDPGTLGLPFRLSHFKLQPWSDCVFLASPSLQALQVGAQDKVVQLKRNLWESLKKMFLA